jgi:hypothetical protein
LREIRVGPHVGRMRVLVGQREGTIPTGRITCSWRDIKMKWTLQR